MRSGVLAVTIAAAIAAGLSGGAAEAAGPIERACNRGGQQAASPQLCGCIQRVADATLKRGEQRMAASFFRDPHRAQEIRQSDDGSHAAFWQRYKFFGAAAETHCRLG